MSEARLRKIAGLAVFLVAGIAATVSYLHIYRLAIELGQPQLAAWLMPLSVDGAVGAASVALVSAARSDQRSPWTARLMLALCVLATLAANAYSGSGHGIAGMTLAMWPGVAFVGSAETALSMVRRSAKLAAAPDVAPTLEAVRAPHRPSLTVAWSRQEPRPTVTAPKTVKATKPSAGHGRKTAAHLARNPDLTGKQLAAKLGLSERSGRRILADLKAA